MTLQGAGGWHSVVHTSRFIDQSNSSGGVHIKDFAVLGEVTERVDSNPDNFVNGSLGPNSSVSGMWLQHLKVGLWLMGNNDNLVVENSRFLDMTADGLNLNGNARGVRVRATSCATRATTPSPCGRCTHPTPTAASRTTRSPSPTSPTASRSTAAPTSRSRNNLVSDTNALGSGIAISNQKFLDPFHPLAGTITVDGNTLVRTGAMNPNWSHPMGALRVDAYDSAIDATVNITNTTITDSPYSAFEFVSGSGRGYAVRNVTVDGATVRARRRSSSRPRHPAPPPSGVCRPPAWARPASTTAPTRPVPAPSPSPTAAATPAGTAPGRTARPGRSPARATRTPTRPATWPRGVRPRPPARRTSTRRAGLSTATRTATGSRPTTPSRSPGPSTSARPRRCGGWC